MELIKSLKKIKEIYSKGGNMIQYMNKITNADNNSLESIQISYDFQAGSYIKKSASLSDFEKDYAKKIVELFNKYNDYGSILEAGVGEATTLYRILEQLKKSSEAYGFDISWSRIKYALSYLASKNINHVNLFMGDLFNIPMQDNSVDLVYTWHSLEPNGGREKEALMELYRITGKYLFVFEPSCELGNSDTKKYIDEHGYVKNLSQIARELGYEILEHNIFIEKHPFTSNNTSVLIIRKNNTAKQKTSIPYACPVTKTPLELIRNNYFSKDSMLLYPVIDGIPCLIPNNAIIATHYLDTI
ncbi:MAG: methyltransferase domain-containing protein [Bacteroidetes bacterium]|nr:methyltransferase domain-containing protein [Bacteroidota bacterium]